LGTEVFHKNVLGDCQFRIKSGQGQQHFTWGRQNISVHTVHVLSDLDKILYKRWPVLLLSIRQFRENRPREGRSFLMDVNGITFTRVRQNCIAYESK